jgi:hypothetical protein
LEPDADIEALPISGWSELLGFSQCGTNGAEIAPEGLNSARMVAADQRLQASTGFVERRGQPKRGAELPRRHDGGTGTGISHQLPDAVLASRDAVPD